MLRFTCHVKLGGTWTGLFGSYTLDQLAEPYLHSNIGFAPFELNAESCLSSPSPYP